MDLMKSWMLGIFILMLPLALSAQNIQEKEVEDFDQIRVFGKVTVLMVPGTENKVHIESKEVSLDKITTEVEDDELNIKMTSKLLKKKRPDVFVRVTFKGLKGITTLADAKVEFEKPIIQKTLNIKATSGSYLILSLNTKELDLRAYEGATVEVEGKTEALVAKVNTGGLLTGTDLVCQKAEIKLNAGGKGELTVEKELKANVNTGSDFSYYGTPEKKEVKTILGGTVSAWDEEE